MGASRSRLDQARVNANAGNGAGALTDLYNKLSQGGVSGGQQSMTGAPSSWGYDGAVRQGKGGNGSATPGAQTGGGLSGMRVGINPPRPYDQSVRQGK